MNFIYLLLLFLFCLAAVLSIPLIINLIKNCFPHLRVLLLLCFVVIYFVDESISLVLDYSYFCFCSIINWRITALAALMRCPIVNMYLWIIYIHVNIYIQYTYVCMCRGKHFCVNASQLQQFRRINFTAYQLT